VLPFSLQGTRLANGGSSGAAQVGACALQCSVRLQNLWVSCCLSMQLDTKQQLLCQPA
jgi:hypothetical protein